jgi:signal transduction histidine kinase
MRERLRLLDASLTVSSGPGGTTVETRVPIPVASG